MSTWLMLNLVVLDQLKSVVIRSLQSSVSVKGIPEISSIQKDLWTSWFVCFLLWQDFFFNFVIWFFKSVFSLHNFLRYFVSCCNLSPSHSHVTYVTFGRVFLRANHWKFALSFAKGKIMLNKLNTTLKMKVKTKN